METEMETFMGGSAFSFSSSSSPCSTNSTYQPKSNNHNFSNGTFPGATTTSSTTTTVVETCCNLNRRESESYVAVKGQSLIVTRSEGQKRGLCRRPSAVALNGPIVSQINMRSSSSSDEQNGASGEDFIMNDPASNMEAGELQTMSEIERHLHQMTQLLRPQDSIKLVVRLESSISSRIRYLAVVSCMEDEIEEFCLLGMDCNGDISLRLVLAILSHTIIRLDGDGGFCIQDGDGLRSHVFKPVSVATMWSALQSLYRASHCAKNSNNYQVIAVKHYESLFQETTAKTDVGYFNEWNTLPGVENSRRPMDTSLSEEELAFQQLMSTNLRQILIAEKDLDEVTSKQIRTKLETKMNQDLTAYKSFIDTEMMKILGQLDAPAKITDNLYLGTEWNASHQQDLFEKEIGCILNVTSEIDNFFPDSFRYMNIPVIDTEETNLLRYFNDSYKFINEAHKEGKNVLVHCKMGISRSATIVIAYVMKNKKWDLRKSLKHVQDRRNCIRPNPNFMKQLEVYEGILKAKRFSNVLEKRSKSESNLKQTEFSLRKDSTISTSNHSLNGYSMAKRPPRKYFNTAPARLKKPHKHLSIEQGSGLNRSKSYSCATIPTSMTSSRDEDSSMEELVPRDVMDSFRNAVNCLEKFPPYSPRKAKAVLPQHDISSSHISDSVSPATALPPPSPHLTRNSRSAPTFISETLILHQSTGSNETELTDLPISQPPVEITVEPAEPIINTIDSSKDVEKMDTCDYSHLRLNIPGNNSSIQTWLDNTTNSLNNPDEAKTFDPLDFNQSLNFSNLESSSNLESRRSSTGKSNLKSCRHPFNGHTFSVSPNQVLNITSLADLTKCSVRHLVNEFELFSNRKNLNFSNELSSSGFPLPVSNLDFGSKPIYKTWINIESASDSNVEGVEDQNQDKDKENNPELLEDSLKKPSSIDNLTEVLAECLSEEAIKCQAVVPNVCEIQGKDIELPCEKQQQDLESDVEKTDENRLAEPLAEQTNSLPQPDTSMPSAVSNVRSASGVVKKRLQAFEAKSTSDYRSNSSSIMSHHRSQSGGSTVVSPPTSTGTFPPVATPRHTNNQGHCKKLSLPHFTATALTSSTNNNSNSSSLSETATTADTLFKRHSPPVYNTFLSNYQSERKGSLDSSTPSHTFRTIPNRPVQVRGFASPTITSNNKIIQQHSTKHKVSGSSGGIKQEHGSTHPLKLLPQATKLS